MIVKIYELWWERLAGLSFDIQLIACLRGISVKFKFLSILSQTAKWASSSCWHRNYDLRNWAGLFKAGLRYLRISAKFQLRYESLKSKFSYIRFAHNLMNWCSKKNLEIYPEKCFWTKKKKKKNSVKISPRVSANRSSNNWALNYKWRIHAESLDPLCHTVTLK